MSAVVPSDEVVDHLDVSDSETVRRHAATFRKARLARLASDELAAAEPSDEAAVQTVVLAEPSDGMPRGALQVARHARAHGWAVREVTTAVLAAEPSDEDPSAEGPSDGYAATTVSVRCWGPGRWCGALYRRSTGKWTLSACLVADAEGGLRRVKAGELRAYVAAWRRTL